MEKEEIKHETAQALMEINIPIIEYDKKISDAKKLLSKEKFEILSYIYITRKNKKLVGVISVKEIFRQKENTLLKDVMKKELVYANPNTDQERVAYLAIKNKLKVIPVLDKNYKILGAISAHTIFNILHQEGIEDTLRSAGIKKFKDPATEIINASTITHFKKRVPWLIIGLIGGVFAALIISFFEKTLDLYIILAAFIPAVVYMADAVGGQAQTIFIRSMALDKELNYKKYSFRELKVNFLLGLVLGIMFLLVVLIGWKDFFFGLIIGVSIFATVLISMAVSIILPITFNKMKFDPAVSTGPFATALRDLTSLIVYFGIAKLMINYFL